MSDSSKAKTAAIRARLKFPSREAFIQGYAPNISKTGIFVKTAKPKAEGVRIKFEFQIADGSPVLRGIGEVSWNRTEAAAGKPPGMGIKFLKLDASSRQIIDEIVAFKGEGESEAEEPVADDPAPAVPAVETAPAEAPPAEDPPVAQEVPVVPAPAEDAAVEQDPAETQAEEVSATPTPTPSRAKPARRRRSAKSARKKDAGRIDFGAIDSMLAEISSDSDAASKRVSSRRARRAAQKEPEVESLIKEVSEAVQSAPVADAEPVIEDQIQADAEPAIEDQIQVDAEPAVEDQIQVDAEPAIEDQIQVDAEPAVEDQIQADAVVSEPKSDSGISAVDGEEPTFEPSIQIKLDEVLELKPEHEVEIDLGSDVTLKEDSGFGVNEPSAPASDDDAEGELFESSVVNDDEEETDRFDLAVSEEEQDDEEVELIPLADDDDGEEDQTIDIIPLEEEEDQTIEIIPLEEEDDDDDVIEEADIEELLEDDYEGQTIAMARDEINALLEKDEGEKDDNANTGIASAEESVGDFMDEMKKGEEVLSPAATETLLQNAEVEEALDDIFQMAGNGETAEEEADVQEADSHVTEDPETKTKTKKKKGFFKKLFG